MNKLRRESRSSRGDSSRQAGRVADPHTAMELDGDAELRRKNSGVWMQEETETICNGLGSARASTLPASRAGRGLLFRSGNIHAGLLIG